jgi:hypothetical protein
MLSKKKAIARIASPKEKFLVRSHPFSVSENNAKQQNNGGISCTGICTVFCGFEGNKYNFYLVCWIRRTKVLENKQTVRDIYCHINN